MVERVVMAWSYEGVEYEAETLIDTLNKIWVRSLGLSRRDAEGDGPRRAEER
ncbi:hypothetical protein GCM10023205_84730 [Yinghuangia aomiensis]|uniref:Uncharacterized protein n=1 Tax=Yinghuangia aomiensis TaxID=676205 RepID=A0ABP9IIK4_9ACTN